MESIRVKCKIVKFVQVGPLHVPVFFWNCLGEAAEEAFEEDEDGSILKRLTQFPKTIWAG